jgi:O-antigen ligase
MPSVTQIIQSVASPTAHKPLLSRTLGLVVGLVPMFVFFMPKSSTPMMIVFALIGVVGLHLSHRPIPRIPRMLLVGLIVFCAWALLSSLWAINIENSLIGALKLIGNIVVCTYIIRVVLALEPSEQAFLVRAAIAGVCVAGLLLAIELIFGNPIYMAIRGPQYRPRELGGPFWLNAPTSLVVLLTLPITHVIAWRRGWGIASSIFLAILGVTAAVEFRTGLLALIVGAIVAFTVAKFGRRAVYGLAALVLTLSVILPILPSHYGTPTNITSRTQWLPSSAQHRVAIWTFTAEKIWERPFAGWGMNSARDLPGGKEILYRADGMMMGEALPLHPHNTMLQLWVELGLPGLLAYMLFVTALFGVALRSGTGMALVCGEIVAGLLLANVSFGIWQAWWLASLALTAAVTLVVLNRTKATV